MTIMAAVTSLLEVILDFKWTVAGNALASRLSSGSSKFDNRGQTPEEKNIFPQYFFCPVERCFPATAFRSRHTSAGGGHAVCQLLAEAVLVLVAATLENHAQRVSQHHAARILAEWLRDSVLQSSGTELEVSFCSCCERSMHRAITAKTEVVHHRCSVKLFQWEMHSDQECKPMTFIQVTKSRQQTTAASSRTLKTRCSEMQMIRSVLSAGEPTALIQREVLTLSDEERRALLDKAGILSTIEIGAAETLAIKAGLAIPWNKLRLLRRWLKSSGICLAGEERMRQISCQIVGDNLKGEIAPFSFSLPSGGEEVKGSPLVYIPHLVDMVVHLLDENERAGLLTWHDGYIPASEVWLKIGGDKGGGTFKMNFQIVNVAAPNSVHNTCVFCCFEAGDSVTNLHVALDRFKDQVEHLHGMKWRHYTVKVFICGDYEFLSKIYGLSGASGCYPCLFCIIGTDEMATPLSIRGYATRRTLETMCSDHQHYVAAGSIKRDAQKFFNSISLPIFNIPVSQVCPPGLHITLGIFTKLFHLLEAACHQLDLELALHTTDFTGPSSSFSKYSQELQNLSFLQAELEKAQQSHEELQNMATYMALVNGEKSPLAVKLLKQSAAKMKSVKALKAKVAKGIATVKKGFSEKEGPFVKQLDSALQLIGVQRQQYFGGAFVGNHVHKALKLPNVKTLCTAISQMAQEKLPHRSGEVAENMKNFINLFSLFGKCHNISDQNFIDEPQIHALDQAIQEFMAFFRDTFPTATVPIKMHLVEDHAIQWAAAYHVGYGLLGEQGAESIHAKFTRLSLAFVSIKDRVKQLQCIVKEHLLSIEPRMVAAIPPPTKKQKT
eukprot:Em0005g409a